MNSQNVAFAGSLNAAGAGLDQAKRFGDSLCVSSTGICQLNRAMYTVKQSNA